MHFALSEEQLALQEAARSFLADLPGPLTMTEQADAYDAAAWTSLVEDQGWPAILVPEEAGGWGFGLIEMAVVFEEVGRALTPCPLFGTVALAVTAVLVNGNAEQQEAWLGELASGATGTLILDGITATEGPDGVTLSGTAEGVTDGHTADILVVHTPQGMYVVRQDAVSSWRVPVLDTTRPLARVTFDAVPAEDTLAGHDLDGVLQRASVLLAAESVGAADACLAEAVDYACVRKQFGQVIGRFQAIQHKLADMCVDIESARAATWYAALAVHADQDDAALAAHTAKALASDALMHAAGQSIQAHGGIGFTWEHTAHVYFKRARAAMQQLGHPRAHRAAVAAALMGGL